MCVQPLTQTVVPEELVDRAPEMATAGRLLGIFSETIIFWLL